MFGIIEWSVAVQSFSGYVRALSSVFCLLAQQIDHGHHATGIEGAAFDLDYIFIGYVHRVISHIAGGGEISLVGIIGPLAEIIIGHCLRNKEMQVSIPLAMTIGYQVDGHTIHGNIYIGAVVSIEAADKDLVGLASSLVLRDEST